MWLTGPKFLSSPEEKPKTSETDSFELVDPSLDAEIRPQVSSLKAITSVAKLGSQRLERFSTWRALTHAVACLIHVVKLFKNPKST